MWHRWMSEDEGYVSCLVCGGTWSESLVYGTTAANGDDPSPCSGDTSQGHGDPVEHGDLTGDPRYRDDCNCLFCC